METEELTDIIAALDDLKDDTMVPKNVRMKLARIIEILNSDLGLSIKVNKALDELDDIQSDANLQSFTRTQIWNIASLLESV